MYSTEKLSPLELHLDEHNPRFKVNLNPTQDDIRFYLLTHEDTLTLATRMQSMDTLLPGERIIIYKDNGKNIVLEGNRRACCYQLFLNRTLIPENFSDNFPTASSSFLNELHTIDVDVVENRDDAMSYLTARHIIGVKAWSTVSKWRISYEYYIAGKTIEKIAEQLLLKPAIIKSNICKYKALLRSISNPDWSPEERQKLSPLNIKPDKLIRFLTMRESTTNLGLSYSESYDLVSTFLTKEEVDTLLYILGKMAFIDQTLNTRSTYNDVLPSIQSLLDNHKEKETVPGNITISTPTISESKSFTPESKEVDNHSSVEDNVDLDNTGILQIAASSDPSEKQSESLPLQVISSGSRRNLPYFFQGLKYDHLDPNDVDTHGVCRICVEISTFSRKKMVNDFPLCAVFLTRALIEQSIIYYSKKHMVQAQSKYIWSYIAQNGKTPELSRIIESFKKNLDNYITDTAMKQYFNNLFSNYNQNINPLNWVIHRPAEFQLPVDTLCSLPSNGLLALINFFIA